jgi:hypothetical protein
MNNYFSEFGPANSTPCTNFTRTRESLGQENQEQILSLSNKLNARFEYLIEKEIDKLGGPMADTNNETICQWALPVTYISLLKKSIMLIDHI